MSCQGHNKVSKFFQGLSLKKVDKRVHAPSQKNGAVIRLGFEPKTPKIKRSVEGINISRMRRVSRGLAFLGLYAMGFKKKNDNFGWRGYIVEEEFVYLR